MGQSYNNFKLLIFFLFIVFLSGCASQDSRVQLRWDVIHQQNYNIAGQVIDCNGAPVKHCQVYLIQRKSGLHNGNTIDINAKILKVSHMVNTDSQGQYYFIFEPVKDANEMWVSFLDPENIYKYKSVCINNKLGDTILQYPGNDPVSLNVVLDR
jgi:hypothetical protein